MPGKGFAHITSFYCLFWRREAAQRVLTHGMSLLLHLSNPTKGNGWACAVLTSLHGAIGGDQPERNPGQDTRAYSEGQHTAIHKEAGCPGKPDWSPQIENSDA